MLGANEQPEGERLTLRPVAGGQVPCLVFEEAGHPPISESSVSRCVSNIKSWLLNPKYKETPTLWYGWQIQRNLPEDRAVFLANAGF